MQLKCLAAYEPYSLMDDSIGQGKNEWKVILCILLSSYKLKHMYILIITCMWEKKYNPTVSSCDFHIPDPVVAFSSNWEAKKIFSHFFRVFFSPSPRAATFIKNIVQITKEQIQYDKLTNTLIPFERIFSLYSDLRLLFSNTKKNHFEM